MPRDAFLYVVASFLCLGVGMGLLMPWGVIFVVVLLILGVVIAGAAAYLKKSTLMLGAITLLALSLGIGRAQFEVAWEASQTLLGYIGQTASIVGTVAEDPDRRDTSLHLSVQVEKINNTPARGEILVMVGREESVSYRDHITIQGLITAPQSFETDTGHTFDYPGYLRAHGISAIMKRAEVKKIEPTGPTLLGLLFTLKHHFERSLERLYPEPDGSLMEGVLLGEKHGIPKDLTNTFIQSGLIHVVVLSGYNITVVSEGVFRLLSFLPRTLSFSFGGTLMILFALMTGAGAATVRALAMGLIALVARYWRRPTIALRALAVAAAGMVLWTPEAILHDSGFILSVLATFGLITLSPWVDAKYIKYKILTHKRLSGLREFAVSTTAVQLFVLPVLLYFSGVFSFVSVPANVLALPVVSFAMLLGFIAGLLGFISPTLGFLPALASDVLLKWMMLVANTAAAIPLGFLTIGEFSPLFLIVVYIPLTWFAVKKYQTAEKQKS